MTQGVIFGGLHAHNHPTHPTHAGQQTIINMVAGLILGALQERYGLVSSMGAHAISNSMIFIIHALLPAIRDVRASRLGGMPQKKARTRARLNSRIRARVA